MCIVVLCSVTVTHQGAKSNDLEDTLQRKESGEDYVEVLQHCFIEVWSSMELKDRIVCCFTCRLNTTTGAVQHF